MKELFTIPETAPSPLQLARLRVETAERERDKAISDLQKTWQKIHPDISVELEGARAALILAEQRELDAQKIASIRS